MGRKKKYNTEEERKAAEMERHKKWVENNREKHRESVRKYKKRNKEKIVELVKGYYQRNKDARLEYGKKYSKTEMGRASNLICSYKDSDRNHNRGECTLTAKWIVENIFSKPCHYCGETDWHKLGCDRIDNDLPHTPENVVPCCCRCNKKKSRYSYDEFMRMIGKKVG